MLIPHDVAEVRVRGRGSDPRPFKKVHERGHVVRDEGLQVVPGPADVTLRNIGDGSYLALRFPHVGVRIEVLLAEIALEQMSEQALLVMKTTTSPGSIFIP